MTRAGLEPTLYEVWVRCFTIKLSRQEELNKT